MVTASSMSLRKCGDAADGLLVFDLSALIGADKKTGDLGSPAKRAAM